MTDSPHDCTCLPGEGPCRCAELDERLKDYEQPMPSDVVRKLVDFIKADEPARCDADTDGCNYGEPHKHGFACDKTCDTCHGHYDDIDPDAEARGLDAAPGSLEWFAEERRRRDAARTATAKHLASGALRPALTATEEKYYWLVKKPAWWRRLFRR